MVICDISQKQPMFKDMKSVTKTVLSVVMPALNEEEGIGGTIRAIPVKELSKIGYEVEILVVDNGSTDKTAEVAKNHGAKVVHEDRRGYGRAYKTGFEKARGSIIVTVDADMTYPVEDIPTLVGIIERENLDFITTNRFAYIRDDAMSLQHRIGNNILTLTTRILFQINLKDSQSGMWVLRKSLLPKMTLKSDSMAFSQELKVEACHFAKCHWREVPIEYRARAGKVKLRSWRDGFGNLRGLLTMRITRQEFPATVSSTIAKVAQLGMSRMSL